MEDKKKDPIADIVDSVTGQYKDAFKTMKENRKEKKLRSNNEISISFMENKSRYLYDFMQILHRKFYKIGVPIVLIPVYAILYNYKIPHTIVDHFEIDLIKDKVLLIKLINFGLVGVIVGLYSLFYKGIVDNLDNYFKKKFKISGFITKEFQLPKFKKYIKNNKKEIDYHFKTDLHVDEWTKEYKKLEMVFKSGVSKIQNYHNRNDMVIIKTNKERVDYYIECRNIDNAIDKRLQYGFNFFNIYVDVINTIEKQYQTIIEFNSKLDRSKILQLKDDLKHRTNISNLQLQTNDNTDYKAIISRTIDTIDYNKLLENSNLNQENNILVGVDKNSNIRILNIFKITHSIVAGSTGFGKSNIVNVILTSLYSSNLNNVVYCLLDPKKAELKKYRDISNTLYAGENEDMYNLLLALEKEMDRRASIIDKDKFVKDIEAYNNKYPDKEMSYVVVVIEEIADLIIRSKDNASFNGDFVRIIQRLAQFGRSLGYRLFLCTQQPKADVINTTIKMNCMTRFAFGTDTGTSSRLILDNDKAVNLKKGELILQQGNKDTFIKAPLLDEEIESLEKLVLDLENRYKNVKNDIVSRTIQTMQTSVNSTNTTVQLTKPDHANHTNNYTVLVGDKENSENTSTNLVGGNFKYMIENEGDLLGYYLKVVDQNRKLPSVAVTSKNTNKSTTTIQKWRKKLIENGDITINGQNAYLTEKSKEA